MDKKLGDFFLQRKHIISEFFTGKAVSEDISNEPIDLYDEELNMEFLLPPAPENVRIFETSTDRIVFRWDPPEENVPCSGVVAGTLGTPQIVGTDTLFTVEAEKGETVVIDGNQYLVRSVTDDFNLTLAHNLLTTPTESTLYVLDQTLDVVKYQVQLAFLSDIDFSTVPADWTAIYLKSNVLGTHKAFKVDDKTNLYVGRIRSWYSRTSKSAWIPATLAGNSDPSVDPDAVGVGAGGQSLVEATWTLPGDVQVGHYPQLWTSDDHYTFVWARARVSLHNINTHPNDGCPGPDQGIQIMLHRHSEDESIDLEILESVNNLYIDPDTHRDVTSARHFQVEGIHEDQTISVEVIQAGGATRPGSDLVVHILMERA